MKKKIVYLAPHLSTGGMPQYLFKQIELLNNQFEIYCVEWDNVTGGVLVVQRNKIQNILGKNLITLGSDKNEIFKIIKDINPDIVHLQEIPELFIEYSIAKKLYDSGRNYTIIETSHDSSTNPENKVHFPDKFLFVSEYQKKLYKNLPIPSDVVEYPIEFLNRTKTKEKAQLDLGMDPNLKHIVNIGLFTPRKNQAEIIEYAKLLKDYPIQFHFVGNHADNFKWYWEPLMKEFPSNCKWWNERTDVDNFYQAADLFLFTSKGNNNDKETMPLVIREAISWQVPSLIYNLSVYENYFDKFNNIKYLNEDKANNIDRIIKQLNLNNKMNFTIRYEKVDNKFYFSSFETYNDIIVSIKDTESNTVLWSAEYDTFHANVEYWIIPTPKSFIDFETNPLISSITMEFYQKENLVYKKEVKIKSPSITKHKLLLNNNTEPTFNNYVEFFVDKIYDKYLKDKEFETVVDVGANVGLWIEYVQTVAKCKNIYAVEPNLKALECLKKSYADSITIVDKAMSGIDGELEFFVEDDNSTISSTVQYGNLNKSYKVKSIKFKTFLQRYNIKKVDLLKIDIETGEYPLIESLEKTDFEKIDNILLEYHLLAGRTYDGDVKSVIKKLEDNGYFVYVRSMHEIGGFIFATKTEIPEPINNVNLRKLLDSKPCAEKTDLASLVNDLFPNGLGAEIGVLCGDYSKLILERWHKGTLYLIDTWRHLSTYIDMNGQDDSYHYDCLLKTCENIKPWQDRAHIIRMDSVLAASVFPDEYFDFIYIDADHSYEGVVRDLKAWWPKIKKGGLFCGDDYIPHDGDIWLTVGDESTNDYKTKAYAGKFGVRKAVTEFALKNELKIYETKREPYWKQWYTFKPF